MKLPHLWNVSRKKLTLPSNSPIVRENIMQTPTLLMNRYRKPSSPYNQNGGFFDTYPIRDMVRGLFVSSILWTLLAVTVYIVYTLVLSAG
jgi:hypothetical protein